MAMFSVSLTIADIDAPNAEAAATQFLAALMSADWSHGLFVAVSDYNRPNAATIKIDGAAAMAALHPEREG